MRPTLKATEPDILAKLEDLAKQASSEKSHYYVATVVGEAHREIAMLRAQNKMLWNANRKGMKVYRT